MSNILYPEIMSILSSGSAWCKGACARDVEGLMCPILSPKAVQWDLYGATLLAHHRSGQHPDYTVFHDALKTMGEAIPSSYKSRDLDAYNDDSTWADIQAIIATLN